MTSIASHHQSPRNLEKRHGSLRIPMCIFRIYKNKVAPPHRCQVLIAGGKYLLDDLKVTGIVYALDHLTVLTPSTCSVVFASLPLAWVPCPEWQYSGPTWDIFPFADKQHSVLSTKWVWSVEIGFLSSATAGSPKNESTNIKSCWAYSSLVRQSPYVSTALVRSQSLP